jgi:hypothetical protein
MKIEKLGAHSYLATNGAGYTCLIDPIEKLPDCEVKKTLVFLTRHQPGFFDRDCLENLPQDAAIFIPEFKSRRMFEELEAMGFTDITELDEFSLVVSMGFKFRVVREGREGAGETGCFIIDENGAMSLPAEQLLSYPWHASDGSGMSIAYSNDGKTINVIFPSDMIRAQA